VKTKLAIPSVLLLLLLLASGVQAQLVQSGDLVDHIDDIISVMPTANGGGDYLQPNVASRALWREIIDHILAGELSDAHTKALTKNYQVVLYTDTATPDSTVHILLERTPESTSRYWGTFLFNTEPLRSKLVIQSPHPRYDSNTGYQSIRMYTYTGARAFFVSGTHRCNGSTYSPCDGTTSACSENPEPYRYSDQCHVVASTFQITTEAMLDDDPDILVIQPHGYGQDSGEPDLIISNGTRYMPSGTDYAVAIRDAMHDVDPTQTAVVGHVDLWWNQNLGTWNTQGRLVNGSSDPCDTSPTSATGRFVHIEQARVGLRDTAANRMKLIQAVAAAVPMDVVAVPSDAGSLAARLLAVRPNPLRSSTRIEFELEQPGRTRVDVVDVAGRRVASLSDGFRAAGPHSISWNSKGLPSGVFFVQLSHDGTLVGRRKCVVIH
jgi:hypothetical protein